MWGQILKKSEIISYFCSFQYVCRVSSLWWKRVVILVNIQRVHHIYPHWGLQRWWPRSFIFGDYNLVFPTGVSSVHSMLGWVNVLNAWVYVVEDFYPHIKLYSVALALNLKHIKLYSNAKNSHLNLAIIFVSYYLGMCQRLTAKP